MQVSDDGTASCTSHSRWINSIVDNAVDQVYAAAQTTITPQRIATTALYQPSASSTVTPLRTASAAAGPQRVAAVTDARIGSMPVRSTVPARSSPPRQQEPQQSPRQQRQADLSIDIHPPQDSARSFEPSSPLYSGPSAPLKQHGAQGGGAGRGKRTGGADGGAGQSGTDSESMERMRSYTNVKSFGVGGFSFGIFIQNLVLLLRLPPDRPQARGLLIVNLTFAALGILLTLTLYTVSWSTLDKSRKKGSLRGLWCGDTLRLVNFVVAVCSVGVSITSGALSSFVSDDANITN